MYPVIKFGAIELSTNYLLMYVAIIVMFFGLKKNAAKAGLSKTNVVDIVLIGIFAGIVGARLWHVLFDKFSYFIEHPLEIVMIHKGGFSSMGGGVFALILCYFYTKKVNLNFYKLLDSLSPCFLSEFFIRLGCFFAGCCYGNFTDSIFGVRFHQYTEIAPKTGIPLDIPIYPSQLFFALNSLLIYFIAIIYEKRKKFDGEVFLVFSACYMFFRFLIEITRHKSSSETITFIGDFPLNLFQCISIPAFLILVSTIFIIRKKKLISPLNSSPVKK